MVEYTQIKPLPDWLDESENKIKQILQKGKRRTDIEKLNNFFPIRKSIKIDIPQRDSCFKLYNYFINNDINDLLNQKMQRNNNNFKYHEIRHQLFIPFLSLNTRIYEKCINLCYLLNTQIQKPFFRFSEIFSSDFSKKFNLENEINKLTQEYGYCLSLILFFRNQFLHSGEYSSTKENFFISNNNQDKDMLNLTVVKKAYDEYKNRNIKTPLLKSYFDLSEKIDTKAGEIIKKCANISDHYMGCLIDTIIHEKWKNK